LAPSVSITIDCAHFHSSVSWRDCPSAIRDSFRATAISAAPFLPSTILLVIVPRASGNASFHARRVGRCFLHGQAPASTDFLAVAVGREVSFPLLRYRPALQQVDEAIE
jgi:hypothetical protein